MVHHASAHFAGHTAEINGWIIHLRFERKRPEPPGADLPPFAYTLDASTSVVEDERRILKGNLEIELAGSMGNAGRPIS